MPRLFFRPFLSPPAVQLAVLWLIPCHASCTCFFPLVFWPLPGLLYGGPRGTCPPQPRSAAGQACVLGIPPVPPLRLPRYSWRLLCAAASWRKSSPRPRMPSATGALRARAAPPRLPLPPTGDLISLRILSAICTLSALPVSPHLLLQKTLHRSPYLDDQPPRMIFSKMAAGRPTGRTCSPFTTITYHLIAQFRGVPAPHPRPKFPGRRTSPGSAASQAPIGRERAATDHTPQFV